MFILNSINKKLENNNYKLTEQRAIVLDVMVENKGKHLSAEDVLYKARKKAPSISMSTVYRTLEKLSSIDVLYKTMLDKGRFRYELCKDEYHRHHHVICIDCGSILEVKVGEELLSSLETHLEKKGFKIKDHELKSYGHCPKCNKG
ncbi:Ferric uptake regulation protein FUR [Candidatus Syntrophocurvum alkaliphilum]|uniref:Ferric uptake regulation protein FUR n=1 Tax=Candidatus Syntrophocurvum alkaliphilum TaxID=2293317 RepID=A0A6I6DKZ3_9FIRM|nr:Fur family transcriptional regulator [Candidatus Syntrophocurvum alkaliphilum]QGU00560.1 Ferric uptake regulation protein FUR [Candidatus Syntrophocurvum alkaliphilum]